MYSKQVRHSGYLDYNFINASPTITAAATTATTASTAVSVAILISIALFNAAASDFINCYTLAEW